MKYSIEKVKKIIENKIGIQSVKFLGAGNHSEAFCINKNLVIKLPKHKKASACIEQEIKVLEQIQGKFDLQIPNVVSKGKFKNDNEEFVYFISKKLEGKNLSHNEFLALPQHNKDKCATIIARFLYVLHNQKQALGINRKDFVLLHGDFSLNHILFDKNNLPCSILDFGDTRIGKLMSDFIYLLDEEDDEEFGKGFGLKVLEKYNKLTKENNFENNI